MRSAILEQCSYNGFRLYVQLFLYIFVNLPHSKLFLSDPYSPYRLGLSITMRSGLGSSDWLRPLCIGKNCDISSPLMRGGDLPAGQAGVGVQGKDAPPPPPPPPPGGETGPPF